jgi:hypothetical protein
MSFQKSRESTIVYKITIMVPVCQWTAFLRSLLVLFHTKLLYAIHLNNPPTRYMCTTLAIHRRPKNTLLLYWWIQLMFVNSQLPNPTRHCPVWVFRYSRFIISCVHYFFPSNLILLNLLVCLLIRAHIDGCFCVIFIGRVILVHVSVRPNDYCFVKQVTPATFGGTQKNIAGSPPMLGKTYRGQAIAVSGTTL